jgi:hypothetical protein
MNSSTVQTALLQSSDQDGVQETTMIEISESITDGVVNHSSSADGVAGHVKKHSTTVKSSDGKFHRFTYDPELRSLEFVLLKLVLFEFFYGFFYVVPDFRSGDRISSHRLTLNLNEVLSVRSTRIKLSCDDLPKTVPAGSAGSNKEEPPNVLYVSEFL